MLNKLIFLRLLIFLFKYGIKSVGQYRYIDIFRQLNYERSRLNPSFQHNNFYNSKSIKHFMYNYKNMFVVLKKYILKRIVNSIITDITEPED